MSETEATIRNDERSISDICKYIEVLLKSWKSDLNIIRSDNDLIREVEHTVSLPSWSRIRIISRFSNEMDSRVNLRLYLVEALSEVEGHFKKWGADHHVMSGRFEKKISDIPGELHFTKQSLFTVEEAAEQRDLEGMKTSTGSLRAYPEPFPLPSKPEQDRPLTSN
ncbi:hypothetical protein BDV25DRAFT_140759 [Aspergillus avenaceus]|uniref:Uncharacterized protein n=1 Tax=Aspergillus avenaceus TaxID=36643 RepID=A0A5N6TT22_ASPAV|nr:hypothetical protein BDV25DRAFT_140759 [Aspergillus avenaceus]